MINHVLTVTTGLDVTGLVWSLWARGGMQCQVLLHAYPRAPSLGAPCDLTTFSVSKYSNFILISL